MGGVRREERPGMGPRRWARVGGTPPGQHFDHEGLEDERGSGSVKSPPHKAPGERERDGGKERGAGG